MRSTCPYRKRWRRICNRLGNEKLSKSEIWRFTVINNIISLCTLYLIAVIIAVYMLYLRANHGTWHHGQFGVWVGVLSVLILMLFAWRWFKGIVCAVKLNGANKPMKILSLIYLIALPVVLINITPSFISNFELLFHK